MPYGDRSHRIEPTLRRGNRTFVSTYTLCCEELVGSGRICRVLTVGVCCLLLNALLCSAEENSLSSGIDRSTFDSAVKPGDNFFLYVNGNWIKHNPIPPEYSRWGAFPKLRGDNLAALREV